MSHQFQTIDSALISDHLTAIKDFIKLDVVNAQNTEYFDTAYSYAIKLQDDAALSKIMAKSGNDWIIIHPLDNVGNYFYLRLLSPPSISAAGGSNNTSVKRILARVRLVARGTGVDRFNLVAHLLAAMTTIYAAKITAVYYEGFQVNEMELDQTPQVLQPAGTEIVAIDFEYLFDHIFNTSCLPVLC